MLSSGKSVMIYVRSVHADEYEAECAEARAKSRKAKNIRADMTSGMLFTPLDDKTTAVSLMMNM